MRDSRVFLESFLDGFGAAGLDAKLRRPGSPASLFAEEDSPETQQDLSRALAMLQLAGSGPVDVRRFPGETALLRRLVEDALKKAR